VLLLLQALLQWLRLPQKQLLASPLPALGQQQQEQQHCLQVV
jgi:hypothetical protein